MASVSHSSRRAPAARALQTAEVASGGLESHFLRREFLLKTGSKQASPEDLFSWLIGEEADPNASTEGDGSPSNGGRRRSLPCSVDQQLVMRACAFGRLVDTLQRDLNLYRRTFEEDGTVAATSGAASGWLRAKATAVFDMGMASRGLEAQVGALFDEREAQESKPPFLEREALDVTSAARDGFWARYFDDYQQNPLGAGKKTVAECRRDPVGIARSSGCRRTGAGVQTRSLLTSSTAAPPLSTSLRHLDDAKRRAELPALFHGDTLTPGPYAALELASCVRPDMTAPLSPLSPLSPPSPSRQWLHDKHSKSARSFELARLAGSQRSSSATLSKLRGAMRAAAAAADGEHVQYVPTMRTSAGDPFLVKRKVHDKPLDSIITHSASRGKLPPVVGFASLFEGGSSPTASLSSKAHTRTLAEQSSAEASSQYIRSCRTGVGVPTPLAQDMAILNRIIGSSGGVATDNDLCSIAELLPHLDRLSAVDLTGSSLCTDEAMDDFLQQLRGKACLTLLNLSGCKGIGRSSMGSLAMLLQNNNLAKLNKLDLSGVRISHSQVPLICEVVSKHDTLRNLSLSNCGLAFCGSTAALCLPPLLGATVMQELDLSWNVFDHAAFGLLGAGVSESEILHTLSVANCGGSRTEEGEAPITALLEKLSRDGSLKLLDISANLVDHLGALVLEDALAKHRGLQELLLNSNPLGEPGLRSLLRLFCGDASALQRFECEHCSCGTAGGVAIPPREEDGEVKESDVEEDPAKAKQKEREKARDKEKDAAQGAELFDSTCPVGRYKLNLRRACDRATLRMLYKACEKFGLAPEKAFKEVEFSSANFSHASKDDHGNFSVPSDGCLKFLFSIDDSMASRFGSAKEGEAAAPEGQQAIAFLSRYAEAARIRPGVKKLVPLLAHWRTLDVNARALMLDALSRGFQFELPFVLQLCKKHPAVQVLPQALPSLAGGALARLAALSCAGVRTLARQLEVAGRCQKFLQLNPENPTGHYSLDLRSASQYCLAECLFLIDRWEAMLAKQDDREDLSQNGNWSNLRNCVAGGARVTLTTEWQLRGDISLAFDFASWRRPTAAYPKVVSDDFWSALLLTLSHTTCASADRLVALRAVSHELRPTAAQLRELVGTFGDKHSRAEAAVMFALHLSDPQNTKLVRNRLLDRGEWAAVRARVGNLALLPAFQPEDCPFEFDLGIREERIAAMVMVQIASREKIENIRNEELILPDETPFKFEQGVPIPWGTVEGIPTEGRLTFTYVCGPEDRSVACRRDVARKFCGWQPDLEKEGVCWWTSLSEVPESLLDLFFACVRAFPDPAEFFSVADDKKQGNVSYADFAAAVAKLGWEKYVDDLELSKEVFRELDRNAAGQISRGEFGRISQMWKDLRLITLEFLSFLDRACAGDLDEAWERLDGGRGSMSLQVLQSAAQQLGFFGSVTSVFRLVEQGGAITGEGWQSLKAIWQDRTKIRLEVLAGTPERTKKAED